MPTEMPHDFLYEFMTLLAILNPVSAVPILLAVSVGLSPGQTFRVGCYALLVSFLILLFFVTGGWSQVDAEAVATVASNGGYLKAGRRSDTLDGSVWGAGYEFDFGNRWSLRAETGSSTTGSSTA
jgi:hypothetical protein